MRKMLFKMITLGFLVSAGVASAYTFKCRAQGVTNDGTSIQIDYVYNGGHEDGVEYGNNLLWANGATSGGTICKLVGGN